MTRRAHPMAAAFAVCVLTLAGLSAYAALEPRIVPTHYATYDYVIASQVVNPQEEGADAGAAIQAAIDEVHGAGGGVVFLPEGRYRLEASLIVKEGVTLRGDWAPPPGVYGTILMPVHGRGQAEGPPAVVLERGAGIRELAIWYPEQKVDAIAPYPWAVRSSEANVGDNATVMNVTLVNPYQGFKTGPEWNELHTLRNVYATPLKTGVFVDTTTDIGRLVGVHFGPEFWAESGLPGAPETEAERRALAAALKQATGVDMGRSDWEYLYDLNVAGYGKGMVIRKGERGTTNAVMYACDFERCTTGLVIESLNGIGLAASGCTFDGAQAGILAPASFDTVAQFNACTISGGINAARIEGPGVLTFQNCTFDRGSEAVITAEAGGVSILASTFSTGGPHVVLGEDVYCARILGNTFEYEPRIIDQAECGDVMISHLPLDSAAPGPIEPDESCPQRHPASSALHVVSAFGASPELDDNTEAFAKALETARASGGGTVYVPAGNYRFKGQLTVPEGVELRGCFDVPHHTVSGGSVLMPLAGRGDAEGKPFIQMEAHSGLRGLTFWYPEQHCADIQPYPWTVQSLGAGCWLTHVTLGNAYQGVDFWTHPSDGHAIQYLAGGFMKRGLFVSKSAGHGWVEDTQFNPHYAFRLHASLPKPEGYGDQHFQSFIDYQREHLAGLVFGRCGQEHLNRNFLYAAYDGLAFRDDGGGACARVVMHGSDTASRAAFIGAAGDRGLEFINTQLVPYGKHEVGAFVVDPAFDGNAWFFNSQVWAGTVTGRVGGRGSIVLQQVNSLSGGLNLEGGRCFVENAIFQRPLASDVTVEEGCDYARLTSVLKPGRAVSIANKAGGRCQALTSGAATRPWVLSEADARLATGWEKEEPAGLANTLADQAGGLQRIKDYACEPAQLEDGRRALHVKGTATETGHAFVYQKLFETPVVVLPDTVLRFDILPVNEQGRHVAIDMLFDDGSTLRDSGLKARDGSGIHPGNGRGAVGAWRTISVPIGSKFADKGILAIMVAYDHRNAEGTFEAYIDNLSIDTEEPSAVYRVQARPGGGAYGGAVRITIDAPGPGRVRYTLDGTNPDEESPVYRKPILLNRRGRWELRYAVEHANGRMSKIVFGELYEVD